MVINMKKQNMTFLVCDSHCRVCPKSSLHRESERSKAVKCFFVCLFFLRLLLN